MIKLLTIFQHQNIIRINPTALRKAKIVRNFGLSECNRVNFAVPDPRGGKRGTCPTKRPRVIPCPRKFFLKNVKCHAKNWYKCESNTCAFTECKNGRTLVKYGNLRLLIRDQTTPHCDARNSKCQIEP